MGLSAISASDRTLQERFKFLDALLKLFDAHIEFLKLTVPLAVLAVGEHVGATSPAPPHHSHVPVLAKSLRTVHAAVLLLARATRVSPVTPVVVFFAVQPTRATL